MNRQTHKNKKGGAWFTKKTVGAAEVEAHNALPADVRIGVLVSEKSLASDDSSIRGNPYVIILPQQFKEGDERYAYGSSAADALSKAQQRQYQAARFPDDTYTGVGISSRNLVTPHPELAKQPYVIQYTKEGEDEPRVEYGTSPTFIKRSSIYAATRRIAGKVGSAAAYGARGIGSAAAYGARGIGSAAAYGARGIGSAARGIGKGIYHTPGAVYTGVRAAPQGARYATASAAKGVSSAYGSAAAAAAAAPAAAEKSYAYAAPKQAAYFAERNKIKAKTTLSKNSNNEVLQDKYLAAAEFANQRAHNSNSAFLSPEKADEADTKRKGDANANEFRRAPRKRREDAAAAAIARRDAADAARRDAADAALTDEQRAMIQRQINAGLA